MKEWWLNFVIYLTLELMHYKQKGTIVCSLSSLNLTGEGVINKHYSRKALMTFAFLEILAQAKMQINSYEYRHKWGGENKPRRVNRIIVTCPTAMSRVEQIILRKCAEDAAIILNRFYSGTYSEKIDEKEVRKSVQIIPSVKNMTNIENIIYRFIIIRSEVI